MAERTEMAQGVLERYGIDSSLPDSQALTLLEKEHQKLLRKLNHVFGNAVKEQELEQELDGRAGTRGRQKTVSGRCGAGDEEPVPDAD